MDAVRTLKAALTAHLELTRRQKHASNNAQAELLPPPLEASILVCLAALNPSNLSSDPVQRTARLADTLDTLASLLESWKGTVATQPELIRISPQIQFALAEEIWNCWGFVGSPPVVWKCRNCLAAFHNLFSSTQNPFILALVLKCNNAPISQKRTLSAFRELLPLLSEQEISRDLANLWPKLFIPLKTTETTSQVAILMGILYAKSDVRESLERDIIAIILELEGKQLQAVSTYLLPPLFKTDPSLAQRLLSQLVSTVAHVISVAHVAAKQDLLQRSVNGTFEPIISTLTLRSAVVHQDSRTRLAAFTILIESRVTSQPFTHVDFELLSLFWQYSIADPDKDFTTSLVGAWKVLVNRLQTSAYAQNKLAEQKKTDGLYVAQVNAWLQRWVHLAFDNMSPASPYRARGGALRYILVLLNSNIDTNYAQAKTAPRKKGDNKNVWPFVLPIITPKSVRTFLRLLTDARADIRNKAKAILFNCPEPLPGFEDQVTEQKHLVLASHRWLSSRRGHEAETGAVLAEILYRNRIMADPDEYRGMNKAEIVYFKIVDLLEREVQAAEADYEHAARTAPIHGAMHAIVLMVRQTPISRLTRSCWKADFVRVSIDLIIRAWKVTKPILCSSAPEGIELSKDDGDLDGQDDDAEPEDDSGPSSKVILSAAWRTIAQAAHYLEVAITYPTTVCKEPKDAHPHYTNLKRIQRAGGLFSEWLLNIRHRGAFASVVPCYVRFCEALVGPNLTKWVPEASSLPERWLKEHLETLLLGTQGFTRRSAGLPHCILAVLQATAKSQPRLIKDTVDRLCAPTANSIAQVHAINTLRTILCDSALSHHTPSFIESGFLIAVQHFQSSIWEIRNASLLLFSSLVLRVFGPLSASNTRTSEALARRIPLSDFMARYPTLIPSLQSEIASTVNKTTMSELSGLFAILLLISLLQTVDGEEKLNQQVVEQLIPLLFEAAKNPVWKVREAAADAVTALVSSKEAESLAMSIMEQTWVENEGRSTRGENEVHGLLLIIHRLLSLFTPSSDFISLLDSNALLSFTSSESLAIRSTWLEIIIIAQTKCQASDLQKLSCISAAIADVKFNAPKALAIRMLSTQALLNSGANTEDQICAALGSTHSEVQNVALAFLQENPSFRKSNTLHALSQDAGLPQATRKMAMDLLPPVLPEVEETHALLERLKTMYEDENVFNRVDAIKRLEAACVPYDNPTPSTALLEVIADYLQDDDHEVRMIATSIASRLFPEEIGKASPEFALHQIWRALVPNWGLVKTTRKLLEGTLDDIKTESKVLFAVEAGNTYIDKASFMHFPIPRECLETTSPELSAAHSLLCNSVIKLANQFKWTSTDCGLLNPQNVLVDPTTMEKVYSRALRLVTCWKLLTQNSAQAYEMVTLHSEFMNACEEVVATW